MKENYSKSRAEEYILKNKEKIKKLYRPQYHFVTQIGWLNDPNGMCFYRGEYHLFYQYHPYSEEWGPMHWGHAKSHNLCDWIHLPIALAPDSEYDKNGCFSGTALIEDDEIKLIYTGNLIVDLENKKNIQVQNIATSNDGINFNKYKYNPVIDTDEIPREASVFDFRDPKIFKNNNKYYVVIGSKSNDNEGQVLFYESYDMKEWNYLSKFSLPNMGEMWECPDIFEINGKLVMIFSPINKKSENLKFQNSNSNVYIIGEFNYNTGVFKEEYIGELDSGFDFYAPQTLIDGDGRVIMIAWANTWETEQVPKRKSLGENGIMTIRREVNLSNNKLMLMPVSELDYYFKRVYSVDNISDINDPVKDYIKDFKEKKGGRIKFKISNSKKENIIHLCKNEDNRISIYFNKRKLFIEKKSEWEYLKRELELTGKMEETLDFDILIDNSIIEIFINNGEVSFTSRLFFEYNSIIDFETINGIISDIEIYYN